MSDKLTEVESVRCNFFATLFIIAIFLNNSAAYGNDKVVTYTTNLIWLGLLGYLFKTCSYLKG